MPSKTVFNPTERDEKILIYLNRYQCLRVGQVARLIFNGVDVQVCRRRLKRLHDAGLTSIIEPTSVGKGKIERIHFLSQQGKSYLRQKFPDEKIVLYKKVVNEHYPLLNHLLAINDFRVSLELATRNHSLVRLQQFVSEREIRSNAIKAQGLDRFQLFRSFQVPSREKPLGLLPDSKFILQGKGDFTNLKRLFYLEIDLGTESLRTIREKVVALYPEHEVESFVELFWNRIQKWREQEGVAA